MDYAPDMACAMWLIGDQKTNAKWIISEVALIVEAADVYELRASSLP